MEKMTSICTIYPLTNVAMEAMAHRNRWFMMIYLLNMVIFHGYVKSSEGIVNVNLTFEYVRML